tara:strand:- start:562 stop:1749 length:1188 start_codon:yes stop_codon:yes gene_type:complete
MARMAPIYLDDLRPPLGATRSMSSITTPRMIPGAVKPRSVPMSAAPVFPGQPRPPMPTAAPQIEPMPQRQPMAQVKPAAAPSMAAAAPAAGGGLLNANVGAGLLGAASKIGGGPTRLPVSLGSQIGPALNQFATDYQASQLAAEKKARENALIQKYGPEALVPGAIGEIIKGREAQRARDALMTSLGGSLEDSAKAQVEKSLGMRLTDAEFQQIRVSMASGDPKVVRTALAGIGDDKRSNERTLRTEYSRKVETTGKIIGAANEAKRMLAEKSKKGVDDLATLYNLITALDPGSVVREGEIALGRQIISLTDMLKLRIESVKAGRVLADTVAKEMRTMIVALGEKAEQRAKANEDFYGSEADRLAIARSAILAPRRRLSGTVSERSGIPKGTFSR